MADISEALRQQILRYAGRLCDTPLEAGGNMGVSMGFHKWGYPNSCYSWIVYNGQSADNPIKMDDLGVPPVKPSYGEIEPLDLDDIKLIQAYNINSKWIGSNIHLSV